MLFSDLQHARVAILGMGREGHAVWRQLRKRFPEKPLSIFTESAMDDGIAGQFDSRLDECHTGPFNVSELANFDVLIRSAGVSPYRDDLQQLRALGLQITTASELWFAENPEAKTICISGTMGKSTTAALTSHLLDCAGVSNRLAGNIGRPMLDCENDDVEWWVIELSSYQLSDLEAITGVALLLNLSEEHVDWHRGVERYHADKLRLVEMATGGCVIANFSDPVLVDKLTERGAVTWFNHADTWLADDCGVTGPGGSHVAAPASLPGLHNMQNLAAVLTLFDELGIKLPGIDEALSTFTGLPHRLQLIGKKAGVRYVNDSISTTPVSVSAALQALGHEGVVLLLGGMDRGLDWSGFGTGLRDQAPHAIITLPDNGPKIFDCLKRAGVEPEGGLYQVEKLADAVALARTLAPGNGCILLSPGAPSFPHFRDFEDRGNQFKKFAGIEKST